MRSEIQQPRRRALLAILSGSALWAPMTASCRELTTWDYRGAPKDLVLWGQLAKVGVVRDAGTVRANFLPEVLALDGRIVSLVGFMTPVGEVDSFRRFLLSSRPLDCSHCVPLAVPDIVEVHARGKEWRRDLPILVRGRLRLISQPQGGPIYGLDDAVLLARSS